jgi:amidase
MAEAKGPLTNPAYLKALTANRRQARTLGLDAVMNKHRLDALVAPTFGPPWLIDLVSGDAIPASASSPSSVAAVAGYPHVTVPMGYFRGLPLGISFIGRAWSEPTLIKIAYAYEQATKHRRPPKLSNRGCGWSDTRQIAATFLASLTYASWNQLHLWIRAVDGLRRAA